MKWYDADSLSRAAGRALGSGARLKSPRSVEWDVSGRCEEPVTVSMHGRPVWRHRREFNIPEDGMSFLAEYKVRCRRCLACLKWRAREWTARAQLEVAKADRTWFATLTFHPQWQTRFRFAADLAEKRQGFSNDEAWPEDVFRAVVRQAYPEVQKYFKRLRKSGAAFRYLVVAERHKSGDVHFHALIHEKSEPIRERTLRKEWRKLGFARIKLCDEHTARYCTKYLAKELLCPPRASSSYGGVSNTDEMEITTPEAKTHARTLTSERSEHHMTSELSGQTTGVDDHAEARSNEDLSKVIRRDREPTRRL